MLFSLCLFLTSNAISQIDTSKVVILDSATAARVIQDLEIGDICCEEVELYTKKIDLLNNIIQNDSLLFIQQDSVIANYKYIADANGEKFFKASAEISRYKTDVRKLKTQRAITWIVAAVLTTTAILVSR